ncbi:MAG: hypothetical protein GTO18_04345 [Anaerolineales bacterium]|nr:hypothetical protein [Anaerolineales bacterium]
MSGTNTDRIALALITRYLNNPSPITRFLKNAQAYGHYIDRVIVAYSHGVEEEVVEELRAWVPVDIVCAHNDLQMRLRLLDLGLQPSEVEGLLVVPSWPCHNEVPYGAYRNTALIKAMLEGMDYILFFDDDIYPKVLLAHDTGEIAWETIDFVGNHMDYLSEPDITATTSDYSGYYIIPPMVYEGLDELLIGLFKGSAIEYMNSSESHRCLVFGPAIPENVKSTSKLLGGNLGLDLKMPWHLAPFFSTTYMFGEDCILGRGEDTLLGQAIKESGGSALDIDLRVFHNTFHDFPIEPDIHQKTTANRFYRACLGWIGRNPFLTWFMERNGWVESSFEEEISHQRIGLVSGGVKTAEYLNDSRFERLPYALDAAMVSLPDMITRYERLRDGWTALIEFLATSPISGDFDEGEELKLAS